MLCVALSLALIAAHPQSAPTPGGPSPATVAQSAIERDAFGVPHILAPTWEDAWLAAGYAVAEDRLWQMESSRRVSRGRAAEVFGPDFAASDREVLRTGYTDAELQQQIDALSTRSRTALVQYARGVNTYIEAAKAAGKLPAGYAQNGFQPEPWSPLDSAAIGINLLQRFGRGGGGELRNWAVVKYLQTQPAKDKLLEVLDDLLWQNDSGSPTTLRPEDESGTPPRLPRLTRAITERHLAMLPNVSLLELAPAVRMAASEAQERVAARLSTPFHTGSYAIVVGKERSATGTPLLLSAPQMGFGNPAIIHEMSISAPGIQSAGIDVPGAPGIVIGYTPKLAWGLTTGVGDVEDIYLSRRLGPDTYAYGPQTLRLERIRRTLKIKGRPDETVEQLRTRYGPVLFESRATQTLASRRSSFWMKELRSMDVLGGLQDVRKPEDLDQLLPESAVCFNFFYAFANGDIGWRFTGHVPLRAEGTDPRLPLPGSPEFEWKGLIPYPQMPSVRNPKSGLITNWNNKPAAWWPNMDTPAFGRVHRVEVLQRQLTGEKLTVHDLEMAAWSIARRSLLASHLMPLVRKALDKAEGLSVLEADALTYLLAYDGLNLDGSPSALLFARFVAALRQELFTPSVGSFVDPGLFETALQPTLIVQAIEGRSAFDYCAPRKQEEVLIAAFKRAVARLQQELGSDPGVWRYQADAIRVPDELPIPYRERGTYIQILELRATPRGRNVLPPGVSESGPNARSQVPLSRAWQYKPMKIRTD